MRVLYNPLFDDPSLLSSEYSSDVYVDLQTPERTKVASIKVINHIDQARGRRVFDVELVK